MLEIVNTVVIGALFGIWQKNNILNTIVKLLLLVLFVANIAHMAGKL